MKGEHTYMEKTKKTIAELEIELNNEKIKEIQQGAILQYLRGESEHIGDQIAQVKSNIAQLQQAQRNTNLEIAKLKKETKQEEPQQEKQ